MSENPASKIQEKNSEKETSITEETISNSVNAEFEENSIDELKEKLTRIGLSCGDCVLEGDSGKTTVELKQFGGRFGKDTDGSDINDDGISHKKEGGLKMEVSYETLKNGTSKVYAKLV